MYRSIYTVTPASTLQYIYDIVLSNIVLTAPFRTHTSYNSDSPDNKFIHRKKYKNIYKRKYT